MSVGAPNYHTEYIVTSLSGLENILAEELMSLGATEIQVLNRAVSFKGDQALMYRVNYESRLALRVLQPLFEFPVQKLDDFYGALFNFAWEGIMKVDSSLAIEVVGSHPLFSNTLFAAQKCKDAIADRFRKIFQQRPSVDLKNPDFRIHLYLQQEKVVVSLDSSGDPLFKRGYRKASVAAPLNEVLAAGMIRLSAWDGQMPLLDPFCGSGTIVIEAAMMASQIPAGKFRTEWGFMKWKDFDAGLWKRIVAHADSMGKSISCEIYASDISSVSLQACIKNAESAGFDKRIKISRAAFENYNFPPGPALIVTNPPYGERLHSFDLVDFYKQVGNVLKQKCSGYHAWIIGSDMQALKFVGLKPDHKYKLFNGPIECRYLHFRLFSGSRKDSLVQQGN